LWMGDLGVELYYMRNRWYEPRTGRFLSEDPIGLAGGINPYVYANADPVSRSDPWGLQSTCLPGKGVCLEAVVVVETWVDDLAWAQEPRRDGQGLASSIYQALTGRRDFRAQAKRWRTRPRTPSPPCALEAFQVFVSGVLDASTIIGMGAGVRTFAVGGLKVLGSHSAAQGAQRVGLEVAERQAQAEFAQVLGSVGVSEMSLGSTQAGLAYTRGVGVLHGLGAPASWAPGGSTWQARESYYACRGN
jgi:hypothetical protein